ncbi:MAG: TolC family protein [Duncaniella sp.]|nr:TolC family protein [Muribaculum sp.]MCM1255387.1 TolC family protein [Duncaniella sp.]
MNTRVITSTILSTAISIGSLAADDVWNYDECVEYAKAHNISLQKLRLGEQTSQLAMNEARAQWEPTLDFNTTHGFTNMPWGKGNKNAYNGQVGLNAGWTVWNGGERENSIKRNKLNTEISELDTQDAMRSLETALLQVYLNILYAREAIAIYEEAEKLSGAQADRMCQLMMAGRASKVDYAQLKAQHQQDQYNLVNAQGTYDTRRIELKKLLELGIEREVQLADIEITSEQILAVLPPIEDSYRLAVLTDLQLKGLGLEVNGADLDVEIAKASGLPKISLNAGVGTGYYAPGGSFGDQLKQAWSENIGLTLSIPILDNRRTKTAVSRAKIQKLNAQLDSDQRLTDLAQAVENWYIDTRSAQSRYKAAVEQLASAHTSNELTNEQFNLGLVNPVELMTAHNNLVEARQALLQSKYMALLGQKMIEYYRTSTVSL